LNLEFSREGKTRGLRRRKLWYQGRGRKKGKSWLLEKVLNCPEKGGISTIGSNKKFKGKGNYKGTTLPSQENGLFVVRSSMKEKSLQGSELGKTQ